MWYKNCDQLRKFDEVLPAKDEEIEYMKSIHEGVALGEHERVSGSLSLVPRETLSSLRPCRGKTPPVDMFMGEQPESLLDNWLPAYREQRPGMAGLSQSTSYSLQGISGEEPCNSGAFLTRRKKIAWIEPLLLSVDNYTPEVRR